MKSPQCKTQTHWFLAIFENNPINQVIPFSAPLLYTVSAPFCITMIENLTRILMMDASVAEPARSSIADVIRPDIYVIITGNYWTVTALNCRFSSISIYAECSHPWTSIPLCKLSLPPFLRIWSINNFWTYSTCWFQWYTVNVPKWPRNLSRGVQTIVVFGSRPCLMYSANAPYDVKVQIPVQNKFSSFVKMQQSYPTYG